MKKKNGFISTSVIYSFFLIFVTLFLALILNYMHSRMLLSKINESAQNDINKIKNARIANLNIGDYVTFKLNDTHQDIINETSYILANIYEDGSNKTYEFYSNTSTLNASYNSGTEFISINKFNMLKDSIKNDIVYSSTNTDLILDLITSESLKRVRDNNLELNIMNNIYNTETDYVIYNNLSGTPYINNAYYNMRKYNITSNNINDLFTSGNPETLSNLLASYCNVSYANEEITYPNNNIFGYSNLLSATITTPKYINYCYYSNPENYTHNAKDGIVPNDETISSDFIPNGVDNTDLRDEASQKDLFYRVMIKFNLNESDTSDYFIMGKGTKEDPYVLGNGGKV